MFQHEQEKLRTEVQQVVEENKTLRTQLKDELSDKKYLSTYKFSPNDEVINLQEQIKIIVKVSIIFARFISHFVGLVLGEKCSN